MIVRRKVRLCPDDSLSEDEAQPLLIPPATWGALTSGGDGFTGDPVNVGWPTLAALSPGNSH